MLVMNGQYERERALIEINLKVEISIEFSLIKLITRQKPEKFYNKLEE